MDRSHYVKGIKDWRRCNQRFHSKLALFVRLCTTADFFAISVTIFSNAIDLLQLLLAYMNRSINVIDSKVQNHDKQSQDMMKAIAAQEQTLKNTMNKVKNTNRTYYHNESSKITRNIGH